MKTESVKNLSEFHRFVLDQIIPLIKPQTLFLLEGEVGAGKTELIKIVASHFKMKDVQSPTFAFHHQYQSDHLQLHHVDLYRLKSEEDLESTGFWDLFENTDDVLFVEWSNLIKSDFWPWNWKKIRVHIMKGQGENREIQWEEL